MANPLFVVFSSAVAGFGAITLIWPARVMALREQLGLGKSYWMGGSFYATEKVTRLTGTVLFLLGLGGALACA